MMSTQRKVLAAFKDTEVQETFRESIQKQSRNRSSLYRLVLVTKQYETLATCSALGGYGDLCFQASCFKKIT
jgi:hypothetical protein